MFHAGPVSGHRLKGLFNIAVAAQTQGLPPVAVPEPSTGRDVGRIGPADFLALANGPNIYIKGGDLV